MGVNIFGLEANSVRAHMFPQWGDFTVNSSPTLTVVEECIEEEAGELAGRLYGEDIVASAITDELDDNDMHSAAWLWCVRTLRLMVALQVLRRTTQSDPELAKAYQTELKARLDDLSSRGATALGDSTLQTGTSDPDGPTSHISQFGLTVDAAEDMSTTVPRLRRDDAL